MIDGQTLSARIVGWLCSQPTTDKRQSTVGRPPLAIDTFNQKTIIHDIINRQQAVTLRERESAGESERESVVGKRGENLLYA